MSDVRVHAIRPGRVEFRRRASGSWALVIACAAATALAWMLTPEGWRRAVLGGALGVVTLVASTAVLWRYRVVVDLDRGLITWRRGFVGWARLHRVPLDHLRGIVLSEQTVRMAEGSGPETVWSLALDVDGLPRPAGFATLPDEQEARIRHQEWAGRLRTRAIDRTPRGAGRASS